MKEKHLIIYHKEDNDGLFSMAIIYNYLITEKGVDKDYITLFGADYNDLEKLSFDDDIIKNSDHIIISDVSFDTVDKMIQLKEMFGNNLIWIDHHKPMIDNSIVRGFDDIYGIRDTKHSALYNAFKYFYTHQEMPELFKVLSAWDSWSYEAEGIDFNLCRFVNIGANNKFNLNPDKIINYVYFLIYTYSDNINVFEPIEKLKEIGEFEAAVLDRTYENNVKAYGDFSWTVNGRSACAMFIQGPSNSQMFNICKDKVQNGIVFKRLPDSNWVLSLYNTDNQHDFHCGEYLKEHFNGGGHEGAAGCQISEEIFIQLLQRKMI